MPIVYCPAKNCKNRYENKTGITIKGLPPSNGQCECAIIKLSFGQIGDEKTGFFDCDKYEVKTQ